MPRNQLPKATESTDIRCISPALLSHQLPQPFNSPPLPSAEPWFEDRAFQTDPEPEKEELFFDAPEYENAELQTSTIQSAEVAVETSLTQTESVALQISTSELSVPVTSSSISSQTPLKDSEDFSGQAIPSRYSYLF